MIFAALPFALGILSQRETLWIAALFALLVIVFRKHLKPMVTISFLALGFAAGGVSQTSVDIPLDKKTQTIVRVTGMPQLAGKWLRSEARIISFKDSTGEWREAHAKLLLNVDSALGLQLGDTLMIEAKHYSVFDYYINKGIVSRVYVNGYQRIGTDTALLERMILLRGILSDKFDRIETTNENRALMQALTLGDRSEINRDQRDSYSRAGAAHLLAVSGLHVGIIFAVLSFLLGWLSLLRRGRYICGVVVIVLMWVYAALTGFSPSVLRAVLMFSLYQLSLLVERDANQLNTLLGAAFVLLLINPNYILDIGFQLSFTAMLGIILLYRPIFALWRSGIWRIAAVTLAAQIAVVPLSVYYFGTLPLVGLLVNLGLWLTVPSIMVLSLLYLVSGIGFVGTTAAWLCRLQNGFVSWCASQRWIAITDIVMPLWMLAAIYGGLIIIIIILMRKNLL